MKKHKKLSTIALLKGMLTNKNFAVVWKVTPHNAFSAYLAQNTLDCLHVIKQFKKDGWTVTAGNRGFYFACERIRKLEHLLLHRGIIINKTVFPVPSVFETDGLGVPRPIENVFSPQTVMQSFLQEYVNITPEKPGNFVPLEDLHKCYCQNLGGLGERELDLMQFKAELFKEAPELKKIYYQKRRFNKTPQFGFQCLTLTAEGEQLLKGAAK